MGGQVLMVKRAIRCQMAGDDKSRVIERIAGLPAAMSGQFHNLDIKRLADARRDLWRLRVGDFRIVYEPADGDVIIYRIERRDDTTYSDLDDIAVVRRKDGLQIVDVSETSPEELPSPRPKHLPTRRATKKDRINPLSPFSSSELERLGIPNDYIAMIRSLAASVDIAETLAAERVPAAVIEVVGEVWNDPTTFIGRLGEGDPSSMLKPLAESELGVRARAAGSSDVLTDVGDSELQAILSRSIEDWMFYLHPSQARVVRHEPTGPARVRGGPGTGKTVAAIHRARHLIRTGSERVLLTTFISALPAVWSHLLQVFAPEEADRISTRTVDSLAAKIVVGSGERYVIAEQDKRVSIATGLLSSIAGLKNVIGGARNLITEFDYVIAGRGLTDLDAYLGVERTGRGTALAAPARRLVWQAYEGYLEALDADGITDFHQLRLRALNIALAGQGPRFDGVVVDEAQDLTEVGMRLLMGVDASVDHSRLLLVGDGQQSIYPGGFSLRSLGLDVRGRSFLLRVNWRNTQHIETSSEEVIGDTPFGDLEEEYAGRRGEETPVPRRLGRPAQLHLCRDGHQASEIVVPLVQEALLTMSPSDVALLGRTNKIWKEGERWLHDAGIRTMPIARYRGGVEGGVRVGTFPGSKGLEFKLVILLGVDSNSWKIHPFWLKNDHDRKEHDDRELRTLFVAMTRARDDLILIAPGRPPVCIERADWTFDTWDWR